MILIKFLAGNEQNTWDKNSNNSRRAFFHSHKLHPLDLYSEKELGKKENANFKWLQESTPQSFHSMRQLFIEVIDQTSRMQGAYRAASPYISAFFESDIAPRR